MKRMLIFVLPLLILFGCQAEKNQPNIIIILTDDLGYGDLGCFGAEDIATPNIDRIAADGIRLTASYAAAPICSPSRAGLLTGRLPVRMGIHGVFFPESFTGMSPEEVTIAEILKPQGYATGMVGKWHLGHREKFLPLQQGFDSYFGIPYSNDMESVVYMQGNEVVDYNVDQRLTTKTYTDKAVNFIDEHADQPFFLYVAHTMPHVPLYASDEFLGTSERGLYGDVVQEIDWSVGEILKSLEDHGILDNTLVVFTSDNGPWLVMEDHGGLAGPLRGGKFYTWEGGVRVPTVAMWPEKIPAGQDYDGPCSLMDWLPTIAEMTNAPLPADRPLDGEPLLDALTGTGTRPTDTILYIEDGSAHAYRNGDFKVKKPHPGFPGANWKVATPQHDSLLFNLAEDVGERQNLFHDQKQQARELFREMQAEVEAMQPLPPPLVIKTNADNSHFEYLQNK